MEMRDTAERETIIVTGSSGLIGSALVERFRPGYNVVGFDLVKPEGDRPGLFVEVDVTSDESVRSGFEAVRDRYGEKVASIIHLAAFYDFSGEPSPKYDAITVEGTERLLREAERVRLEQFVFSSTMLVHQPTTPGQPIDESHPLEGKWAYPASKIRTEELLRAKRGGTPLVVLRIAGIYDDAGHSIPIARQIQRIYEKDITSRVFPGNLDHGQAYLHLEDLVDAVERVVERRFRLPEDVTFLLGEDDTVSYGEAQEIIGEAVHGKEWDTHRIPQPVAKAGAWVQEKTPLGGDPFIRPWMIELADDHYELNLQQARDFLAWEPKHRLRDALPTIVARLKADPEGWYEENGLELPEKSSSS